MEKVERFKKELKKMMEKAKFFVFYTFSVEVEGAIEGYEFQGDNLIINRDYGVELTLDINTIKTINNYYVIAFKGSSDNSLRLY